MKPEPRFKVGDRVRLTGNHNAGTAFTISFVSGYHPHENLPASFEFYYTGDGVGLRGVWEQQLELVDPRLDHFKDLATLAEQLRIESTPPVDEYNDPNRERLLRQIDDLNSVVRRRNETITQLQAQLRESTVGSTLSNLADQLGLTADQASKALELGSYLLATGIRRTDIDLWREMEMRFLRHRAEKGRTE